MHSETSKKMQKSTLRTSLPTRRSSKADYGSVAAFNAVLKKHGSRLASPDESKAFREVEARAFSKKRLVAA